MKTKNSKNTAAATAIKDAPKAKKAPKAAATPPVAETPVVETPVKEPKAKKVKVSLLAGNPTGFKVCDVKGSFQIFLVRKHTDGSYCREGQPLAQGSTAEEASELIKSMAPASVKTKDGKNILFVGEVGVAEDFHSHYGKKVGELVAPTAKAKK